MDEKERMTEFGSRHLAWLEFGLLELAGLMHDLMDESPTSEREKLRIASFWARAMADKLERRANEVKP